MTSRLAFDNPVRPKRSGGSELPRWCLFDLWCGFRWTEKRFLLRWWAVMTCRYGKLSFWTMLCQQPDRQKMVPSPMVSSNCMPLRKAYVSSGHRPVTRSARKRFLFQACMVIATSSVTRRNAGVSGGCLGFTGTSVKALSLGSSEGRWTGGWFGFCSSLGKSTVPTNGSKSHPPRVCIGYTPPPCPICRWSGYSELFQKRSGQRGWEI